MSPFYYSNKAYHSQELISGFVLFTKQIHSGAKQLLHLFTEKYGKITIIFDTEQLKTTRLFPLDLVEIRPRKPISSHENLIGISSIEKCISAQTHFISLQKPQEITSSWKKRLQETGSILGELLLPYAPRKDIWNFLEALFQIDEPFLSPLSMPLLIMSFFFTEEGINREIIEKALEYVSPTLQKEISQDIEILFQADSEILETHMFRDITAVFLCDLLGIKSAKGGT